MSETVHMSCAWRKHDPSRGSWQRALKSLSWEQHCLWAWIGGWQERSFLISTSQTFPFSSCASLSSKYHPSAPHHRAQNFSGPLRVLPLSMLREGRKRQEQEGTWSGWHPVALQDHLICLPFPTFLCARVMHTYKHKITPCLWGDSGCRPEGTAESFYNVVYLTG